MPGKTVGTDGGLRPRRLSAQSAQVREAVKQFPGSSVKRLAVLTLIPIAVFHRRLIELERQGLVAKDDVGVYHAIPETPEEFPVIESCNGTSSTR